MKYVDVLESEKLRRQLSFLLQEKSSDPDTFGKSMIMAAWGFCNSGDVGQALNYIDLLTPEYIKDIMPKQMDEDKAFAKMVDKVTDFLIDSKVYMPFYRAPEGTVLSAAARA